MYACTLTIFSSVDGKDSTFRTEGRYRLYPDRTEIRYAEENSNVLLCITSEGATIERTGEYTLFLPLLEGKRTSGKIGIGGSCGSVDISTKKSELSLKEDGIAFSAAYALHFDGEMQRMKLRVLARKRGNA